MYRYTVEGLNLGSWENESEANRQQQEELVEALDSVFYEQFEEALKQGRAEFQLRVNDVELECEFATVSDTIAFTVTRTDNRQSKHYLFMVDLTEIDDSILSDDINQVRAVTLWVVTGVQS